ncbi:hypothetical protein ACEWY4_017973 [Coilia grayii]|uniref:Uncharacterized protein n=1 Tax=Coilia grayii TaxID=363190 RepID=A0ABD1JIC8_9TELE
MGMGGCSCCRGNSFSPLFRPKVFSGWPVAVVKWGDVFLGLCHGTMNGSHSTQASTFLNQTTTHEALGQDMSASIHEFKVFNITLTTLALCVLTVTGVLCSISLLRRRRQSKQARVYESAVGGLESPVTSLESSVGESSSSVAVGGEPSSGLALLLRREVHCSLRRPLSALLLRRREAPKDNSRIYYIYSNPLPVGKDEDEEEVEEVVEEEVEEKVVEELGKRGVAVSPAGGVEGRRGEKERPLSLYELAQEPGSGITLHSETFYMQL